MASDYTGKYGQPVDCVSGGYRWTGSDYTLDTAGGSVVQTLRITPFAGVAWDQRTLAAKCEQFLPRDAQFVDQTDETYTYYSTSASETIQITRLNAGGCLLREDNKP